jgi:hypothetical protein
VQFDWSYDRWVQSRKTDRAAKPPASSAEPRGRSLWYRQVSLRLAALTLLIFPGLIAMDAEVESAFAQTSGARLPSYPLKLSANHRYLVDRHDKPFLIVGDSPQGLMCNLSEADAEKYFADRQAHGFNTAGWIDLACAGSDFPENKTGATYDGILPFTGFVAGGTDFGKAVTFDAIPPFVRFKAAGMDSTDYDLSKPNEAYFRRLDRMIEIAAKHGILVFIDPAETNGWLQTLRNNGLAAAYAYGQYLGRRYKRYANVAWMSGNDFLNWRIPSDDAFVLAVAKGIRSVAPEQLQSVEINYNTSSSLDDTSWAPIISLNGTYTYAATYIQMLHSYNQTPVMPAYLVEAHYDLEDVGTPTDYGTPKVLRRQEYWTMLSGGAGQFYGNHYTWSFAPGWNSHMDTVGVSQLKIWKDFFSSLAWQDLIPDQKHTVLVSGFGNFGDSEIFYNSKTLATRMTPGVSQSDYATAARTIDGSTIVVYLPTARTITVSLKSLKNRATAKWFDPTNGVYLPITGGPFPNTGNRQFTPPGNNHAGDSDWVLLLNASGRS